MQHCQQCPRRGERGDAHGLHNESLEVSRAIKFFCSAANIVHPLLPCGTRRLLRGHLLAVIKLEYLSRTAYFASPSC